MRDFPLWVIITLFLNLLFMTLLARPGIEVLSAFPKLYWIELFFWAGVDPVSKKVFRSGSRELWTSLDEEESWSPVVALPGRKNLGSDRIGI